MVVAQVAEYIVGVHTREAAVEHGDAYALAVDALGAESLAAHADQLGLERAVDFLDADDAGLAIGLGQLHIALDGLHAQHVGQSLDGGDLGRGGHHADSIHPAASADGLGGQGTDALLVGGADGVVADVVEVGAALLVALYGLGIEIGVGVEGGARLVGKEHPVGLLRRHDGGGKQKHQAEKGLFHRFVYLNMVCNISCEVKLLKPLRCSW